MLKSIQNIGIGDDTDQQDRLVFALLLARIHLRAAQGETPLDQEFKVTTHSFCLFLKVIVTIQVLMRGGEKGGLEGGSPLPGLTEEQTVAVTR